MKIKKPKHDKQFLAKDTDKDFQYRLKGAIYIIHTINCILLISQILYFESIIKIIVNRPDTFLMLRLKIS